MISRQLDDAVSERLKAERVPAAHSEQQRQERQDLLAHLRAQALLAYDAVQTEASGELAIIAITQLLITVRGEAQQEVFDKVVAIYERKNP